jgi:hypothetical protein
MKTFWYIKFFNDKRNWVPVRVCGGGGFEIPGWTYWMAGIFDVTRFPKKQYALDNLKILRESRTKKYGKRFKLVRVTVK